MGPIPPLLHHLLLLPETLQTFFPLQLEEGEEEEKEE